jgi:hypothetical protein
MVNRNVLIVLDRAHPSYDADVQKLRDYSQANKGKGFLAVGCVAQVSFSGYDEEAKYIESRIYYLRKFANENIDSLIEFRD